MDTTTPAAPSPARPRRRVRTVDMEARRLPPAHRPPMEPLFGFLVSMAEFYFGECAFDGDAYNTRRARHLACYLLHRRSPYAGKEIADVFCCTRQAIYETVRVFEDHILPHDPALARFIERLMAYVEERFTPSGARTETPGARAVTCNP